MSFVLKTNKNGLHIFQNHTETCEQKKFHKCPLSGLIVIGAGPPATSLSCVQNMTPRLTSPTDWLLHKHLSNHCTRQLAPTDLRSKWLRINGVLWLMLLISV